MTDDRIELTRRKILGGMGAVGLAGAGAGLGTSAFFSDQETFTNNRLVAGSLDLKVDWEEHYSDWSIDENDDRTDDMGGDESDEDIDDDGTDDFEVEMEEPENPDAYRPFPPGTTGASSDPDPLIWVPEEFVDDFMDNTSVEAYPDGDDNDGIAEFPIEEMNGRPPCDFLADVGDDDEGLDPDSDPLGRTDNDDTRLDDGSPAPLINLQDVKPGDFGEITFSTHLCDNPGYLWMNMPGGLTASENGVNEPESQDDDEEEGVVELAEEIQTTIWYDDCNNLWDCEDKIDLMIVADTSGSIDGDLDEDSGGPGENDESTPSQAEILRDAGNNFISALEAEATSSDQIRAGFMTFNGPGDADEQQTVFPRPALRAGLGPLDQFDVQGDTSPDLGEFLPSEGNGNTPMPHALDLARKVLNDQGRADAKSVMLMVTDGLPDYTTPASDTIPYTVEENEGSPLTQTGQTYTSGSYDGASDGGSSSTEQEETEDVAADVQSDDIAIRVAGIGLGQSGNAFLRDRVAGDDADPSAGQPSFFYNPDDYQGLNALAETIATDIAGGVGECEEVIFRGSLREAEAALTANEGRGVPLEGDLAAEDGGGSGRNCFAATATHCFGMSWWLPLDHGNEVQTDGVNFDLGFYAEQCRHNDGSGATANAD
jgi:predicted ribosomally synthesized peptide with SipW-like signal peptide